MLMVSCQIYICCLKSEQTECGSNNYFWHFLGGKKSRSIIFSRSKVPILDEYDERQTFVQAPTRGRGSSERIIDENRSNFNVPSQSNSNKSNREKLIDKLKVRPITTTPEPVTTTRRAPKEPASKKTKYSPITR